MPLILLPLITVVCDAAYLTITKIFFRRYGMLTSREFIWLQFLGILFVLMLVIPFYGEPPTWEVIKSTWWQLALVAALSVTANILYFWGIEHEKISEVQPFLLFNPMVAIIIAGTFFPMERSWSIYAGAAIAGAVLLWSHYKKHRFAFTKGLSAIMLFMLAYGFEAVVVKSLLDVYSPITLYVARSVLVFICLTIFARPNFNAIKYHHLAPFGVLGALAVAAVLAAYTAFQRIGISETVIIFTLSPILVYILSVIFLGEKWRVKNVIASIVVTVMVVWVSIMNRI